jgi:hypothetical protein
MSPVFGYAKSTQHSGILNNVTHNFSMEYHYAERQIFYCYADFHYTNVVMLSFVMLNVMVPSLGLAVLTTIALCILSNSFNCKYGFTTPT